MPVTRKSFKDQRKDKPSHSDKGTGVTKKGGAGGKGTWGNPKDDIKYMDEDGHAYDNEDPNFDPIDPSEGTYNLSTYTPTEETKRMFSHSITDLIAFKAGVKDSCREFLVSHDYEEFSNCLKDTKYSLYHQDTPAILVKFALDKEEKDRLVICQLFTNLIKNNLLTSAQMLQGFQKLFQCIDDLLVDVPNARAILSEFVGHGLGAGFLDAEKVAMMEKDALDLAETSLSLKGTKERISSAVREYFTSNELGEFELALESIPPYLHFEIVKRIVSLAMDLGNQDRERASVALATLVGKVISSEQAVKGISILLGRVEDIYLDVPDVFHLLSCMVARAVADEVLPPSFPLRLDLAEGDMGFQVAKQAQFLLNQPQARKHLERVWG